MGSIPRNKCFPFLRDIRLVKYRRDRTDGNASATISTSSRVYIHLRLRRAALYAIDRANIHAKKLFGPDAGLADYISQETTPFIICYL